MRRLEYKVYQHQQRRKNAIIATQYNIRFRAQIDPVPVTKILLSEYKTIDDKKNVDKDFIPATNSLVQLMEKTFNTCRPQNEIASQES